MLRLQRADWLLLVILVVLGAGIVLVLSATRPPEKLGHPFLEVPSTFFNDEGGTKALYLVLEELDVEVHRVRRTLSADALDEINGLMMLRPTVPISPAEQDVLLDWVAQGHVLVVVAGPSLSEWFEWERVTPDESDEAHHDAGEDDDETLPMFATVAVTDVEVTAQMNDPIFTGMQRLTTRPTVRFDDTQPLKAPLISAGAEAEPIWRDDRGVGAIRVSLGNGEIVAFGDSYPLSNVGLAQADNAVLLANLVTELRDARPAADGFIGVDEYHLGFEQRDTSAVAIARLLVYGDRGWAVAHLAALAALALLAVGVRFGKPRDLVVRQRRRQSEFVQAAARLLDDAGGVGLADRTLTQHYRQRLLKLLHLDPAASDDAVHTALEQQAGLNVGPLGETSADRTNVSRHQLLRRAKALHRAVETLEHGIKPGD